MKSSTAFYLADHVIKSNYFYRDIFAKNILEKLLQLGHSSSIHMLANSLHSDIYINSVIQS